MTIGSIDALRAMFKGDANCKLTGDPYNWYTVSDIEGLKKSTAIYGDGACALLVQNVAGVPHHRWWRKGPQVRNNAAVPLPPVGTRRASIPARSITITLPSI